MSKLMIVSYPLGIAGEKSIVFQQESDDKINQLVFDALYQYFKLEIPLELPTEGEILNINLLEESKESALPNIRHFSLLGHFDMDLLDAIDLVQENLDSILQRYDLSKKDEYEEALLEICQYVSQLM